MFEGDQKTLLVLAAAGIAIVMMAGEQYTPRAAPETAVESAELPPMPLRLGTDGAPAQTPVSNRSIALGSGFQAELLYGYRLEGLVVTRQEYRNDATSAISPLDLGIVWGPLASEERLADIDFRTGRRAVFYRADETIADVDEWETMVTNNHLIPANPDVHEALMAIEPGQRVLIGGYLVEVTGDGIAPWRSSTRRNDNTIVGGCEIILVRSVEVLPVTEDKA